MYRFLYERKFSLLYGKHPKALGFILFGCCCHCRSVTKSCPNLQLHGLQDAKASLAFTLSQSLLKLMSIESVMPSNRLILHRCLFSSCLQSNIRVFSSESALRIRWPKCWSFSFSISHSNEHSGLISYRTD